MRACRRISSREEMRRQALYFLGDYFNHLIIAFLYDTGSNCFDGSAFG